MRKPPFPRKRGIFVGNGLCAVPHLTVLIVCVMMYKHMPLWWNGRHRGLKIRWGRLRTGSSPVSGTKKGIPQPGYSFFASKETGLEQLKMRMSGGHPLAAGLDGGNTLIDSIRSAAPKGTSRWDVPFLHSLNINRRNSRKSACHCEGEARGNPFSFRPCGGAGRCFAPQGMRIATSLRSSQ